MVSKASEDLPDPESPVKTMSASRGSSRFTSFRLCSLAPRMTRWLAADAACLGGIGPIVPQLRAGLRGEIAEREFPDGHVFLSPHGEPVRGWRHAPHVAGAPRGPPAGRRRPRRPLVRAAGGPGRAEARPDGLRVRL